METANLVINLIVAGIAVISNIILVVWAVARISNKTENLSIECALKFEAQQKDSEQDKAFLDSKIMGVEATALKACSSATKAHVRIDEHINDHAKGQFKTRTAGG